MNPATISSLDDYQALINSMFYVGTGSLPWLEIDDISEIMKLKTSFAREIGKVCVHAGFPVEFADIAKLIFKKHHSRQDMQKLKLLQNKSKLFRLTTCT